MKLNYKLWLEENEKKLFGDGPADILRLVDQLGSLSKAAAEINMSYSQAWQLIDSLEKKLGFKLLEKQVGGSEGGGSTLTKKGRLLMDTFLKFRSEARREMSKLETKYFDDDFKKKLKE
ncbi:MAG: LysR family transcriptional regulator [Halanaerobiales bacterium]|nr:LysR family transcriptional regulator [Halanaerobiales bacterium]